MSINVTVTGSIFILRGRDQVTMTVTFTGIYTVLHIQTVTPRVHDIHTRSDLLTKLVLGLWLDLEVVS